MQIFSKTDRGRVRTDNQDAYFAGKITDDSVFAVVCDGMGGANAGNVASELACSVYTGTVKNGFDPGMTDRAALLKKAVAAANTAVYEKAASDESLRGMGTTLVSALVAPDGSITAINVGDSRMYCIDGGELRQITRDHSYVQYLVDMGQLTISEAENASIKNIIIRSVGNEEESNPDLFTLRLSEGSYILLCSDGLTNCVPKADIAAAVSAETQKELDDCAGQLISLANEGGGIDNITVILGKIV